MNSLLQFLYKHSHWLLFIVLEIICLVLLFTFNTYQGSIYLSTANTVTGSLLDTKDKVTSYFGLARDNEVLAAQNAALTEQVLQLEQRLSMFQLDSVKAEWQQSRLVRSGYQVQPTVVVDNTINRSDNYITLDKGTEDGVGPDMGVISAEGVVGVVLNSSAHYSLVLPVLNSRSSISCKVLKSDYFGYLHWEGKDARYAMVNDLPRYSAVEKGDSIVTSGHSSFFPEGIMVGRVVEKYPSKDGLYVTLKVALSTDFAKLQHAFVLHKQDVDELETLKKLQQSKGKK